MIRLLPRFIEFFYGVEDLAGAIIELETFPALTLLLFMAVLRKKPKFDAFFYDCLEDDWRFTCCCGAPAILATF